MKIEVKDNFIPITVQNSLEDIVSDDPFCWRYNFYTTQPGTKFFFCHPIIRVEGVIDSFLADFVRQYFPFPEWKTHRLARVKLNLNVPYKKRNVDLYHTDSTNSNAISYVYYVINSDGPTKIRHNWWKVQSIHPKKGRIVRFPSNLKHTSSDPYHYDRRIVLNTVFEP